jgi:hypothetical protein
MPIIEEILDKLAGAKKIHQAGYEVWVPPSENAPSR